MAKNLVRPLAIKFLMIVVLLAGCRSAGSPARVRLLPSFDSSRNGMSTASKNLIAILSPKRPDNATGQSSASAIKSDSQPGKTETTTLPQYQLAAFESNSSTRAYLTSKNVSGDAAENNFGFDFPQDASRPETQTLDKSPELNLDQSPSDKGTDRAVEPVVQNISDSQHPDNSDVKAAEAQASSSARGMLTPANLLDPANDSISTDLASLEQLAIENNPALAQQRAIVASLNGRWVQAGLKTNPSLGFSGQQLFSRGDAEQIGMYYGRTFIRQEKLDASQQVVCREMDVALQNLATVQRRVITDVRTRYFQVLIAQRRSDVTLELVKIAEESLKKTSSLFEAELGTRIDVLRSTTELQGTRLQHNTALNQRIAAWKQLSTVVGLPDMPLQQVQGSTEPDTELNMDELLSNLLLLSPEMGAAQADYQRAQAVLHRQCVEPLPDVDVQSILFQHDNGTNGYNSSFQVSLPLPIRNRNQGAISEARMQLTAAHHAQHKVALNLQERLASAWQRYQSSLAEVKGFSAGDGILVNSRKTLELIRKAYDAGEIGSLELITAQRTYSQTSLQYLDALQEYWSARIELEGQLLKDSLQN